MPTRDPTFDSDPNRIHVGGEWRSGGAGSFELRNPAEPGRSVGTFAVASPADIDAAFEAAGASAAAWQRAGAFTRASILNRAADLVDERAEELARAMTAEMGKVITDSRAEVGRAAAIFRYFAGESTQACGDLYPSASDGVFLYTVDQPLGVVLAITPWNFPLAIPAWKIAPALAFGNPVVWKPAEIASLSAVNLTRILIEAGLPAGVLNLLTGPSGQMGDRLIEHEAIDAITFTGSNAVGNMIRERTAARGPRLQLELGGNNPAVVLADADLGLAAGSVARAAMGQTGQRCTATRRAIVAESVAEEFASRLAEAVSGLPTGDPGDDATFVGPLSSASAQSEVAGYLELAREQGYPARAGGGAADPDDGYYVEPTVYLDVDPSSRLARDEIFGPVVSIIRAADAERAVELANDTPFGLSASIFTTGLAESFEFIRRIEAGVVHVNNETTGAEPHVPFGGIKGSGGHFREQGKAARQFFSQSKTVYLTPSTGEDRPVPGGDRKRGDRR